MTLSSRKTRFAAALFAALLMLGAQRSFAQAAPTTSPQAAAPAAKEAAGDPNDEYRQSPMVTKLGSMVGMDARRASAAFTLSNLLILLVALGFLLAKSLPAAFRTRTTGIKKQITDARTATEEANARLSSVEQRLAKLDEQIAAMRAQSEADSEREGQRIQAAAEEEKKRILAAATQEIQSATSTARRELMSYAADLAIEQAARKLVVTPDMDRLLVEHFAAGLGKANGSAN